MIINLGTVRPGSTLRIPFSSFDKDDGSSITMTNFAAADILVYKDGGTTERASTNGFTATTDFDSKTGKHVAIIDLSDNTTAGFFAAGSDYMVAIDAVTVDGVTTGGWLARFSIGHANAWINTTIATLASQTSFTLTSGPAEDDALNGCVVILHDVASAVQCSQAIVSDYTGSTKTVTLAAAPTFTIATTDNVSVLLPTGNVTHNAGVAITATSGRQEVNVSHRNGYAEPTKQTVPVWSDGIVTAQAGSSDSNTVAITFDDSGCDYGILVINYATAAGSMTFVDSKGSKWNLLDNDTNSSVKQAVYECPKPVTGSSHTITVTCTGGGLPSVFFIGTRGVRLVNRADQAATNAVSTGTSVQPGSITPSENNCIVVTCLGAYAGNITAPGGGYTGNVVNTSVAHIGGGLSYIIQTTATATNPTWTKATTGDSVARSFNFLPATQIPGISLDNFADGRVFNRVFNPLTNTYQCQIPASGKYVDEAPASVEMRITDAATSQVVTTWLPVEGLVASGGVWTGTITVDEGGWYARQARSKDGSGHVLANSITTDAKFGVGINVAMLGQSIMQRRFVQYDTPESPNDLTRMYYQGGWTVNYGDGAIAFANDLAETTGLPIGLINYAVPGSGLVFDGGSGYWDSEDGVPLDVGGPLDDFLDAMDDVGDCEIVLWDQGQCDTLNPSFDGSDYAEAIDRLYSVIQTATGRTNETLKFGLTVMGPLNDPDSDSTAAVCSGLRQTQIEWGESTTGAFISSCAIDFPLDDDFAHFDGPEYVSLAHRDAQSVLYKLGLADYPAGGAKALNAWRRPSSANINIPIELLSGANIYDNDTALTGWEVSTNDFSSNLTISSTAIEGRNIVLTLSAAPSGTVKVRYGYGKEPIVTNPVYSTNTPQSDSRRVPLLPRAAMTVETRAALEATDLAAKGTLPISGSNLGIGWKLVTADGTLAQARTTDGIGVVGDSATGVTYSAAVERPDGFESGFFVFDDGLGHEVSEVAVTTAEAGSGGGGTGADIATESVGKDRIFTLVHKSTGLVSEDRKTIIAGSPANTYAIDFKNDAGTAQKVYTITSVEIISGTADGLEFGTAERDGGTQARVRITGIEAGNYTVRCEGTYVGGAGFKGDILIKVVE